jgi:uncharacterized integral membrane protein
VARRRSKADEQPRKADEQLRKADEEHLRKLRQVQRARATKAAVLGTVAVLFIVFVIQNSRRVDVEFLFWTWSVRLIWVYVAATLLGAVGGFFLGRPGKQLRLHQPKEAEENG